MNHELTTEVPNDFPDRLLGEIQTAAGDRVLIDQDGNVVYVAIADDAVRWLVGWLDDRPEDEARDLADGIESSFGALDLPER